MTGSLDPATGNGEPCAGDCGRLISHALGHVPPGHVPHHARGMCNACYQRALRGGLGGLDDIAVERAVEGWPPVRLTRLERLAVVDILTRRRLSAREIARRARCTPRSVVRYRAQLRDGRAA